MKIICAWCKSLIGYKCPLCGGPLDLVELNGAHVLRCTEAATQIYFLDTTRMPVTNGICPDCLAKFRAHKKRLCPLTPEEILAQAEAEERHIKDAQQTEDTGNLLAETMSGFEEPPDRKRE